MTTAIGVVMAQSATRFAALALDAPLLHVRRRHEEAPLAPEVASNLIAQLVREIQAEVDQEPSPDIALCCALEAELDVMRERVISLRYAPGWNAVPFRELLARNLSGAISLATATEAAALAEYERGAGYAQRSMLYVLPAHGVTACVIEQGRVLGGAHGAAGSLDHWPARDDGPRCACGGQGRLATQASAQSIVRSMIGRASDSDESTAAMLRVSGGRAEAMSVTQVVALAAEGDSAARTVIHEATDALALALVPLSLMLDPGVIVIGGQIALAESYYFETLNERLVARELGGTPPPQVVPGRMEPNAALIGAGIRASRLRA
jgi:predicted NBD/HSP70 family sugar kinase